MTDDELLDLLTTQAAKIEQLEADKMKLFKLLGAEIGDEYRKACDAIVSEAVKIAAEQRS
jgi:hypothetical protein